MSTDESKTRNQLEAATSESSTKDVTTDQPSGSTSPTTSKLTINLTTLDKIKRFFFSKEEWEAYLIEKVEEQEKKKGSGGDLTLETKSDSTTKKNVVSWLKTVFPSQEDANSFLKIQIDKMQEGQQSVPSSPPPTNTASTTTTTTTISKKETEKALSSSSSS